MLPLLVNSFYLLVFHTHTCKTNIAVPVIWCAKMQNKCKLLTMIQCETLLENTETTSTVRNSKKLTGNFYTPASHDAY